MHCAARVHVMQENATDPLQAYREVNVNGTLNLACQAAKSGVSRFVFVSPIKVNGDATLSGKAFTESDAPAPQDPSSQSKQEAQLGLRHLAADTGMEVVIIRPPLVYGPGMKSNFAALMLEVQHGWPLPLGAVHNQRSLVALNNLVDLIVTCLHHPAAANQTFLASDGQELSIANLVRAMAQAAGQPARASAGVGLACGGLCLGQGCTGEASAQKFAGGHQQGTVFVGLGVAYFCCQRVTTSHWGKGWFLALARIVSRWYCCWWWEFRV